MSVKMRKSSKFCVKFALVVFVITQTYCWQLLEAVLGDALGSDEKNKPVFNKTQSLVENFGYPFESHQVVSKSGHVLSLHRIPKGIKKKHFGTNKMKQVALFQHGIFAASDSWLFRGPDFDLPYVLADAGYDVWLSNMRGNIYSKSHIHLDPNKDKEFWNFSLHEIANEDYPAIFDYVLNVTKQDSLFFIGHSIGSTVGLIFSSIRPEYNDKIKLHLALAPLAYVNHSISFKHKLIFMSGFPLSRTAISSKIYNIFPRRSGFTKFLKMVCSDGTLLQPLCLNLVFATVGDDYDQLDTNSISGVVTYFPAGTSIYVAQHTLQIYFKGVLSPLDYGNFTINRIKYNKTTPQPYDLTVVKHPVTLHYGDGDLLVTEEDIRLISEKLPNVVGKFKVPHNNFNHMDFMWGIDNRKLVFDKLIKIMEKYR